MTPRATAPPFEGAVSGKELPVVPATAGSGGSGALFSAALASLRLDPAPTVPTAATTATVASIALPAALPPANAAPEESTAGPAPVPTAAPDSKASYAVRAQVSLTSMLQQLQAKLPVPGALPAATNKVPVAASAGAAAQTPELKKPGAVKGKAANPANRGSAAAADAATGAGASTNAASAALLLAAMRPLGNDAPVAASPGRGKSAAAPVALLALAVELVQANRPKVAPQPGTAANPQPVPADAAAAAASSAGPSDAPAISSMSLLADLVSDISARPQSNNGTQSDSGAGAGNGNDKGAAADGGALANRAITELAGAVQIVPGTSVQAPTTATAVSVAVPVADRQWAHAVATRVLVLAGQKIESATLRVNPEHLGPIDVHIDMQESHVNVSFGAAHVETRSALELALPQLREVLTGAGLTLGEATVQQQLRRESQNAPSAAHTAHNPADSDVELAHRPRRQLTLIDEYV